MQRVLQVLCNGRPSLLSRLGKKGGSVGNTRLLPHATNTFSELIHPLAKLPNCVWKPQPHILQFIRSAWLFWLSPSSRSRHRLCCCTATSTHFWSSTIIIYYISLYTLHFTEKQRLKLSITGLQYQDLNPSAGNNTRYSPSKSITERIKFTKRAELWTDFWHLNDIFEPPGRNELIVWKTESRFFFSRLTKPTGVRKTLTPHFTSFFTDFEKKNDCFAV